jgi:hypothetical protein
LCVCVVRMLPHPNFIRMKRQPTKWEKTVTKLTTDKGSVVIHLCTYDIWSTFNKSIRKINTFYSLSKRLDYFTQNCQIANKHRKSDLTSVSKKKTSFTKMTKIKMTTILKTGKHMEQQKFFFLIFLLWCWVGVHCGIYKNSFNILNISQLESPPPSLSFILPSSHSWNSCNRSHFFIYICVYTLHSPYSPSTLFLHPSLTH